MFGEAGLGFSNASSPGGRQLRVQRRSNEGIEGPGRAREAAVAECSHISLERRGLLAVCRDLAGGEEPVEFVFAEWIFFRRAGKPAEEQMRSARK